MKLKCEQKSFEQAISVVSRAVSPKSVLPALEGVLLRASNGFVELFGYDLETGISTRIEAQVDEMGEIVLPAKVLFDIVKRMPGEFVSLSVGEKCLTELVSGAAEFTILGIQADEFPEFPILSDAVAVSLPRALLHSMIDQTIFAVSQSDTKPVHTGSLFEVTTEGMVTVVSVDGYRLALRREKAAVGMPLRFVVPAKALSEVSRILGDEDEEAGLQVSKKHIIFSVGNFQIYSRLLEGDFLNYEASIPKGGSTRVVVNTRVFMNSIERIGLLISDRVKSPLRIKFEDGEITVSCSTALGRAIDKLPCTMEGNTVEMGFNNRYLLDALRNAGSDEIILEISGALSPMKVLPPDGHSFLFLVLPVRLKAE